MTDMTLQELEAQQAANQLAIEALELPVLTTLCSALSVNGVNSALTALNANIDGLTGERKQQAQNLITVLTHSREYLAAERDAFTARATPPEAPAE